MLYHDSRRFFAGDHVMALTRWLRWLNGIPGRKRQFHHEPQQRILRPRRGFAPRLEALEDRTLLSSFTVTNLFDSGPGSLRAAVDAANITSGADVIKFAGGLKGTIPLASVLSITDDLTINGPGAQQVTVSG